MIKLLKTALNSGHKAKYVLFDSWFSNPAQLAEIKHLKLDAIAMIKHSSKIQYFYNEEKLDIKQIFSKEKKRFYNKCWGLDLIKDKASGTYFLF